MQRSYGFHYRKLAENHIRLLELWQPREEVLRYLVWDYNLKDLPAYTAISYRWGDEPATELIFLDGKEIRVRPNLWKALRYLRLDGKSRYVWVDAICIDQENVAERNTQVHMMDRIYSKASSVAVWLGADDHTSDYQHRLNRIGTVKDIEVYVRGGVRALANRMYWSRMWVVQEFLLAKEITILGDGFRMDWTLLKKALLRLPDDKIPEAIIPFFSSKRGSHSRLQCDLRKMLFTYHASKCKDPRDRIFALLSLMKSDERRVLGKFFPNYSLSVEDVVTITLSHLLEGQSDGDVGDAALDLFGFSNDVDRRRILQAAAQFNVKEQVDTGGRGALYAWRIPPIPWWTKRKNPVSASTIPSSQPTPRDGLEAAERLSDGNDEDPLQDLYVFAEAEETSIDDEDIHIVDSNPNMDTVLLENPIGRSFMDLKWQIRRMNPPRNNIEAILFHIRSLFPSIFWVLHRTGRLTTSWNQGVYRVTREPHLILFMVLQRLASHPWTYAFFPFWLLGNIYSLVLRAAWKIMRRDSLVTEAAWRVAYTSYLIFGTLFIFGLIV